MEMSSRSPANVVELSSICQESRVKGQELIVLELLTNDKRLLTKKCLTSLNISANISFRDRGEVAEWSKAADC